MSSARSPSLELVRITGGAGYAVHGLVFEWADGTRTGTIPCGHATPTEGAARAYSLYTACTDRCREGWTCVERGDYVKRVHGRNLDEDSANTAYLCHSITLVMASGKEITYQSTHEPWAGPDTFSFDVPRTGILQCPVFVEGKCTGLHHIDTSAHLPISSDLCHLLPSDLKERVKCILLVFGRIDRDRVERNWPPIGTDIWWIVLGMLKGFDLNNIEDRRRGAAVAALSRRVRQRLGD